MMIKKFLWVIAFFLMLLPILINPTLVQADNKTLDFGAIDAFVLEQMAKHGLPGVALTIVSGDQILYSKGYGIEGNRPMTTSTQMLIGSQSKSFTALAIAQLVEQGKLEFNAPVQRYLPWFRISDEVASSQITINHLLHHTSGLSEAGISRVFPADTPIEEMVRALRDVSLTAPVGKTFQYFNYGYDILSLVIEAVSGMNYADYLDVHIFQPLQMTRSTADPYSAADLATGYTRVFGFPVPWRESIPRYEIGAGFIVSTAEDMANYAIAVKNQTLPGVGKLNTQLMFTPGQANYGMGWWIDRAASTKRISHGGANRTFRTDVNIYPQRDLAFVLLVNTGSLIDHYISMAQLRNGLENLILENSVGKAASGWSVRWIGWGIGIFVLGLLILHTHNFLALRGWRVRMKTAPRRKIIQDIAISFLIPTAILVVVLSQIARFYDYRFNLITSLAYLPTGNPDIFILLLVGSLPDYAQGIIKLIWSLGLSK